jgi:hypothetical protein
MVLVSITMQCNGRALYIYSYAGSCNWNSREDFIYDGTCVPPYTLKTEVQKVHFRAKISTFRTSVFRVCSARIQAKIA